MVTLVSDCSDNSTREEVQFTLLNYARLSDFPSWPTKPPSTFENHALLLLDGFDGGFADVAPRHKG